jgi:Cd2+/Zn2+-exporting ATPase/Cu+-exporting ATPase
MDCAHCARHVKLALESVPGVAEANVLLAVEKAAVRLDTDLVSRTDLQRAVEKAGYTVPDQADPLADPPISTLPADSARPFFLLLGIVFAVVLIIVIFGEGLGLLDVINEQVPWPLMLVVILLVGYPIFRNVIRASISGRIIPHTLMTIGMLAAIAVGEWAAAVVVVFFMRLGDFTESFTTERARRAVKDLTALVPKKARVYKNGIEEEIPIVDVQVNDVVIVRPGEQIPADGEVATGQATVDQSRITGESMPVEVGIGDNVYAATIAQNGGIRINVTHVGRDTTFGHMIQLVEEAEANRAEVQRMADKFSAYFLPIVVTIAVLTLLISGDAMATAAVLLVACSCSIALATPIAMMASIGAAAKRGLLIKGGKYLETLAQADVLLIDKTGTVTLGRPQITDVITLNGYTEEELVRLAGSAELYSEHPLARAVRRAADDRGVPLVEPQNFQAIPGKGVRAHVFASQITVGSRKLLPSDSISIAAHELADQGKTLLYVSRNDELVGILAAADTPRQEVPEALAALAGLGIQHIELLTGDNHQTAAALADSMGIQHQAELLPEDKIAIVKAYQSEGHKVIMVGDGVNDAPALAQADVGIAMGAFGSDVAIEAAHIVLMSDDWSQVPEVLRIAKRTMRVVRSNLWFTGIYNLGGLTLAAFGILPPTFAALAQTLPDLGILGNSSRLLRQD